MSLTSPTGESQENRAATWEGAFSRRVWIGSIPSRSRFQLTRRVGSKHISESRATRSRIATSLLPTVGLLVAVYAVAYMLAARRRRQEHVAATEFKAKVAPYLVEAPEL